MSWVVAAVSIGAGTAAAKGIAANQTKQKNKGYISQAYRFASQNLNTQQGLARQGQAEALNQRGLGGQISPIATAMQGDTMKAVGAAPTTLGQQRQSDDAVQMGLERQDLDQQKTQATIENRDAYTNSLIGAGLEGVQAGANVFTAGKDLSAMRAMKTAAPAASPIRAAYQQPSMTGIDDPANSFGGIHPIDPLGAPGSSWNRSTTMNPGGPNYDFNAANA